MKLLKIVKSTRADKKWDAVFENPETKRTRKVSFGAVGYEDYTMTRGGVEAREMRERYRERHKGDNLEDAMSPGALSWYVLWGNSINMGTNIREYRKHFNV